MVVTLTHLLVFLPLINRTEADTGKGQETEGYGHSSISESEANFTDPYLLDTSVSPLSWCVPTNVSQVFQFNKASFCTQRGQDTQCLLLVKPLVLHSLSFLLLDRVSLTLEPWLP